MRRHAKAIVATSAMLLTLAMGVTLAGAVAPTVTIDAPSAVSYNSVHLSGTVDSQDQTTTYYFVYSPDPETEGSLQLSEPQGPIPAGSGPTSVSYDLTGLKPGTQYFVEILAVNESGEQTFSPLPNPTFTTDPIAAPTVLIDPVTSITGDTAHFSGTINPSYTGVSPADLSDVNWHFECTPGCSTDDSGSIPADNDSHAVSANASGLDPNIDYEVRLVAENAAGPQSATASFKTGTSAPIVRALDPAVITDTSAWIGAEVNPRNSTTTYYVEYSTDPGFAGSTSVPTTQDASAGSGNSPVLASRHVEGLQPNTTYYYRVVASGAGTTVGDSSSFTTLADPLPTGGALPDGRAYEKISPADKNGAEVRRGGFWQVPTLASLAQASISGDAVAYSSFGNFAGDSPATYVQYIARRGSAGWTTEGVNPPVDPGPALENENSYNWFSEDLSLGTTLTRAVINPGDTEKTLNLYLHDNIANAFQTISTGPLAGERPFVEAITPDASHVVFFTGDRLLKWSASDGVAERIDLLPDGSPPNASANVHSHVGAAAGADNDISTTYLGTNPMSEDGSRVYFTTKGASAENKPLLFLREGETTISVDDGVGETRFQVASPDGTVAFLTNDSRLTDESTGPYPSKRLYRWDRNAPEGERLTDLTTADPLGPDVLGTAGASQDASTIYFTAAGDLAPGATRGTPNLYRWHEGEGISLVATLDARDEAVWGIELLGNHGVGGTHKMFRDARVTPDGRFIAFSSYNSLTSYDTNDTKQMYLYDSEQDQLTCVSCSTVEAKSTADSQFQSILYEDVCCDANRFHLSRNLTPDGTRLFFDSNDALVPGDSNGVTDVYEWTEGKIHLISGGINSAPSRLFDVGDDGGDVFFTTLQKLLPSDGDAYVDLYDARVGGGKDPVLRAPCIGDECQGTPTAAPSFGTPSSQSSLSSGNPKPRARCSGRKVRRAGRCVAKKRKKTNTASKKTKTARKGGNNR